MPEIKVIPSLSKAERVRRANRSIKAPSRADLRSELVTGKQAPAVIIPQAQAPVKIASAVPKEAKKLRVAGYCRVSTGLAEQETSIVAQREHYEQYIKSHPDWELAGVYWEAAVSGTKKENRPELQRLIAACKAGTVEISLPKWIQSHKSETALKSLEIRHFTAFATSSAALGEGRFSVLCS